MFNTTYAIPRATTIPADNTEHKVSVHEDSYELASIVFVACLYMYIVYLYITLYHVLYTQVTIALVDLVPELTYSSVPRLSPYSFLQAKATNSSPYTILAGPANVFLDNNFIAKVSMQYGKIHMHV